MTLKNLSTRVVNADGSISVFDANGNCVETRWSDNTSLIYGEPATLAAAVPVWFAPAPSLSLLDSLMAGSSAFQALISGVTVFKLYEVMLTLPDATLKAFFSYLSAHHVALAIEGLPLVAAAGQPGSGVEAFSAPGDLATLFTKIKTLGGNVGYVAWDEPYCYGHVLTGIYSVTDLATQVAASTQIVKNLFPNAKIGDIEPIGYSQLDPIVLQAWFNAYASANGASFDFFQADVAAWLPDWRTGLADVITMSQADNIQVGVIVEGNGVAATDAAWSTQAISTAQQIESDPSLRPDYLIVQSWQPNPSEATSPATAGTLASVAQDVLTGMSNALAVPASAKFNASGLLQSVTWSGGWTAFQDGENLIFASPAGVVVSQFAWSDVRIFAFRPDIGAVALTVRNLSVSTGPTRPVAVTTYSVSVAASGYLFAPVAAVGVGALSVALAPASETGAPGSGITDQFDPVLTGTAPAGATVSLQIDGNSAGTAIASATGAWTFAVSGSLTAGAHLVEAFSGTSSAPGSLRSNYVVSVDPMQRLQSTLGLAPGSDTGFPGDLITDMRRPVFAGTDDPNVQLYVSIDGKQVGIATANASGAWTFMTPAALALGTHVVTVSAFGPPGTSPALATAKVTIDTASQEAAMIGPDPLFDAAWYLRQHPGAGTSSLDAYTHYTTVGWKKGWDPSPFFSTNYYLQQYPDVAASGLNPLLHFEANGWMEGRNPSASFNTLAYQAANPGIPAGEDPLLYYIDSLAIPAIAMTGPASQPVIYVGAKASIRGFAVQDTVSSDVISLTVKASAGTLAMTTASGAAAAGSGTGTLAVIGTAAQVTTALSTLALTSSLGGLATLTLSATDISGVSSLLAFPVTVSPDILTHVHRARHQIPLEHVRPALVPLAGPG